MSLFDGVRRWRARRLHRAASDRLAIDVGGQRLSHPRLLGASRCGRLTWAARLDGRPVKVLECHDPEQAAFIDGVSTSPSLGEHFPEPLWSGDFAVVEQRTVGEKHLKLVVRSPGTGQAIDAIAFNTVDTDWPAQVAQVQMAYRLDVNEFRGARQAQLMVEHVEPIP